MRFAAVLTLALSSILVAGCPESGTGTGTGTKPAFKIGIMTGTVSQGEDEYRGAEAVVKEYGRGAITHVTYPDNFMTESETTISLLKGLADDPELKAIVVAQAVPGTIPALKKIRASRPDLVVVLNTPHEDPPQVSKYADLAITTDEARRGETIVALAQKLGAKTFLHYSFPRHMGMQLNVQRRDIMAKECEKRGLKFVYVNAPDPMGDQGLPGAQKFVLEDVPRQVALYGKDTALFSTNCGMQEPLLRAALDAGAIVPEQCCPSPTHGYPGALGIKIDEDAAGDFAKIRGRIAARVKEKGGSGRFATWPVSFNVVMIRASVDLAAEAIRAGPEAGRARLRDAAAVEAAIEKAGGVQVEVRLLEGTPNYMLVLAESVVF